MITRNAKLGLGMACLLLIAGGIAAAPKAKWTGTIKVNGKKSMAALKQMAKITPAHAARVALAAISGTNKKVIDNELEVERGFLVYCVDIKVKNQKGEHEVIIDAATGKLLAQQLEEDDDDDDDDD